MEEVKPFVSVIIPVYKVEPYLRQCVDSVLAQTYRNLEIILVDDGSPDGCPAICDEYAAKDARVRVIHKENGGLSDARNAGIRAATGEYLLFLDSDDYLENKCSYITDVIDFILRTRLDVYFFTAIQENPAHSRWHPRYLCTTHSRKHFLLKTFFSVPYQAAWLFIARRTFILSNNLFFETGILHEDEEWMPRVLLKNKSLVGVISFPLYVYRTERPNSIVNTRTEKNLSARADIISQFSGLYRTLTESCEKKFLATRIASLYTGLVLEKTLSVESYLANVDSSRLFLKKSIFLKHRVLYLVLNMRRRYENQG